MGQVPPVVFTLGDCFPTRVVSSGPPFPGSVAGGPGLRDGCCCPGRRRQRDAQGPDDRLGSWLLTFLAGLLSPFMTSSAIYINSSLFSWAWWKQNSIVFF